MPDGAVTRPAPYCSRSSGMPDRDASERLIEIAGMGIPGATIAKAAAEKFGEENIRHDYVPPKVSAPDFPVLWQDGTVHSSLRVSEILRSMPVLQVDSVYCDDAVRATAEKWRDDNKEKLLKLGKTEAPV